MSESAINLVIVFICLSLIAINILFYYSLQTTMNLVSDKNRQMPGSYVWFNLIPIFGFFWPLIFNASLAKSIENELKAFINDYLDLGQSLTNNQIISVIQSTVDAQGNTPKTFALLSAPLIIDSSSLVTFGGVTWS
jgi:hypothetical protein